MIDREDLDMLFHIRQASSSQELPYQFLERLNERYHIDAVCLRILPILSLTRLSG